MKINCMAWFMVGMASASLALAQPPQELVKKYLEGNNRYYPEDTNDVVCIEADLTGDQKPEYIFTLESLQAHGDGIWTVYTDLGNKQWKLIGKVDFDEEAFKPSAWKRDPTKFGFYTCHFVGAQESFLFFYEVTTNSITLLERRSVYVGDDGDTKDVAEYNQLFLTEAQRAAKAAQIAEWKASGAWTKSSNESQVATTAQWQPNNLTMNPPEPLTAPKSGASGFLQSWLIWVLLALGVTGAGIWLLLKRNNRR
jgi:hypothetical protein